MPSNPKPSTLTRDLPFDGTTNRFIVFYAQYRDLERAAKAVHITLPQAKRLYRKPDVRAEIDIRINVVDAELAKLEAKAIWLNEAKLDETLLDMLDTEKGNPRARALELGYKKLGLVSDKVQHTGENGGPMVFTLRRIEGDAE